MRRIGCLLLVLMMPTLGGGVPRRGEAEFRGHLVEWVDQDGYAVTGGDIVIGRVSEVEANKANKPGSRGAVSVASRTRLWPKGVVPYVVDPALTDAGRVQEAMTAWTSQAPVTFVARTNETDFVLIRPASSGCSSNVGLVGGQQVVNLSPGCSTASTMHELGHTLGLWHEQARQDREFYIRVDYSSIDKANYSQYDQQISDGYDVGYYDYYSIMHYSPVGFPAVAGPNLVSIPVGIPVGQRDELSPGDIEAVTRLYGGQMAKTTVTTNPPGLEILVDGEKVVGPREFDWPEGSTHTLEVVEAPQVVDDFYRFRFGRWSDNGSQRHVITVNKKETSWYAANFVEEYQLYAEADAGGRVEVSPASPDKWYAVGQPVTVTAIPEEGYRFVRWSGFGYLLTLGNANNPYRLPQVDEGFFLQASFTKGPITRIEGERGALITVDGRTTALPAQIAWTPGTAHELAVTSTSQVPFSSVDLLTFTQWSVGTGLTQTVMAPETDQAINATFVRNVQLVGSVSGAGGSIRVSPAATNLYYPVGTTVTLTAAATGAGTVFSGWSQDLSGTDTVLPFALTGQTRFRGTFATSGQLLSRAVVNGASFSAPGTVAPGELVSVFGLDLGPDQPGGAALGSNGRLLTETRATKVMFDGVAAPISYVSNGQLNVIVPYSVAGKSLVEMEIQSAGRTVNKVTLPVVEASPAVFTANSSGRGNCACLNQDGSANGANNPAVEGSVVVLYLTGEGQTVPAGVDGLIAGASLPKPVLPVRVRIAGREAIVDYAGAAPGLSAGIMQVNARIPFDVPSGNLPVQVLVGGNPSVNAVTVSVQ